MPYIVEGEIMIINLKKLVISILIPLATGGIAGLLTRGSMDTYSQIVRPPLSPPGWVFPVVWTILYILMGVAFYLVWQSEYENKKTALLLYFAQLAMNFIWPILFFNLEAYGISFVWLLIMLVLILFTAIAFYAADKRAGYLMIPYFVWVLFAGYLNLGVFILN